MQACTAQLESALAARDEFLCMASHEPKTPLAALQLQIQGMLRGERSGPIGERLERTLGHTRRLHALVDRMLDVSRAGGGQLRVERFVQLGPSPRHEGFGLGLWIVRQIVAAHAGTIHVQDAEGGGALFVMRMPLDTGAAPAGDA